MEGDCCQVVHRDTDSGLMLREDHYGTKRSLLPANVVQASISQAIPPELVKLSNDEIREKLVEYGEIPGPVNRQTRAVRFTFHTKRLEMKHEVRRILELGSQERSWDTPISFPLPPGLSSFITSPETARDAYSFALAAAVGPPL